MAVEGTREFRGRKIFVSGGGQGIGRAIALAFARGGADVAILVRSSLEAAEAVAGEIRSLGREARVFAGDIGVELEVRRAIDCAATEFGRLDVLVNNAGRPGTRGRRLDELESGQWASVIETNLYGTYYACKAAIPHMLAGRGGAIVNIASIAALRPLAFWGSYSISKVAMTMLTRQLALELADRNIRVNAVAPGLVATPRTERSLSDAELVALRAPGMPLGRPGDSDEIAAAVCFLASDAASYITGQVLVADGGETDSWPIRTELARRLPT